jgi:hypothetical protein
VKERIDRKANEPGIEAKIVMDIYVPLSVRKEILVRGVLSTHSFSRF